MRVAIMAFASLLLSACGAAVADKPRADRSAIQAIKVANAAKDRAMVAGDRTALASLYTEDYRIIDGRAGIHDKRNQVDFMTKSVDVLEARSENVKVDMLSPSAALLTGTMTGRYRMGSKESDFFERYTAVWVKQGPNWRVKHEHASMKPAPESEDLST